MQPSLGDTDSSSSSAEEFLARRTTRLSNASRRKTTAPKRHKRCSDEIRFLQRQTKRKMIPKLSFGRLVREIITNLSTDVTRMTLEALEALQESVEMYVTQVLEDAYLLALHRKRVTLSVEDLLLIQLLRYGRQN